MNFAEFEYCTTIIFYLLNDNRDNKGTEYEDPVCFDQSRLDIKKKKICKTEEKY